MSMYLVGNVLKLALNTFVLTIVTMAATAKKVRLARKQRAAKTQSQAVEMETED